VDGIATTLTVAAVADDPDELAKDVDALLDLVESWDVGTVVERRLDVLRAR
jgi:hypothetical protein